MEGLAENARNQRGLAHGDRPFRHRLGDGLDIDGLKVFFIQARAGGLSSDAQDRDRIRNGGVETGDHIGAGRTGGADADADIAGLGTRIALGHVRCAFDVARQNMIDRSALLQRRIQRIDRSARHAERADDAFLFQNAHCCIDCPHLRHVSLRSYGFGAIIRARVGVLNATEFIFR